MECELLSKWMNYMAYIMPWTNFREIFKSMFNHAVLSSGSIILYADYEIIVHIVEIGTEYILDFVDICNSRSWTNKISTKNLTLLRNEGS